MFSFLNQFTKFEKCILLVIVAIYSHNLFLDVMAVDAAQYASISAEMSKTNSYLEVKEFGTDYLDKPPLLFWLSSMSISLFGVTNIAYKLPSFLFLLFSLYALYRFCVLYYDTKVAKNAVLILGTTQSYFLMTNDVRTDALLTSSVIISCWFFAEYFTYRKFKNLLFASIFIGLAMLAKGPIGIVTILFPIGIHLIYKKQWKQILSFQWLFVGLIVALVLFPMSYGLYHQFDLQPEKITHGIKGQKGLYFYYWLQSFGRITGESVWNNNTPWHFFIGTSLWDFFPWFFMLLFALYYKTKSLFFNKEESTEIISFIGFTCLFFFLSLSKYKLPHYVFVTFPFAAILVADYWSKISLKNIGKWIIVNTSLGYVVLLLLIIYPILFFKENYVIVIFLVLLQVTLLFFFKNKFENLIIKCISPIIVLNLFMSFIFYPKLVTFQSDAMAAKWLKENHPLEKVAIYNKPSHLFNFYLQNPFTNVVTKEDLHKNNKKTWLYIHEEDLKDIEKLNLKIISKKAFKQYRITILKLNFLLESKRKEVLNYRYLIQIDK
ncbi:glycosyltransferase family 39 protein [Flavobacterium sp. J27]|uniref:ArnT family glycosyltransferase n=1 Tax=Flavobacterium sp. J27 TaxID=2060419 RepID=UPI0010308B4A|nr:glycosyltransferase family 39 protein [Flavobacterium sp. J27]